MDRYLPKNPDRTEWYSVEVYDRDKGAWVQVSEWGRVGEAEMRAYARVEDAVRVVQCIVIQRYGAKRIRG